MSPKKKTRVGLLAFNSSMVWGLSKTTCAGIFKQSMGSRNQVGIGLSYRSAGLHSLVELVPWNRFLGSLKL